MDDHLVICGNFNWTRRAFQQNAEQGLAAHSADVAAQVSQRFETVWTHRARSATSELNSSIRRIRPRGAPSPRKRGKARDAPARYGELMGTVRTIDLVQPLAGQRYVRTVRDLIANGQRSVSVAMLGLRASVDQRLRTLLEAMANAVARGLDVRVIYQAVDGPNSDWSADVETLRSIGVGLAHWQGDSRMHARCVLVDDEYLVVGSVGWTPQSIYLSEELSLCCRDTVTGSRFRSQFESWWSGSRAGQRRSVPAAMRTNRLIEAMDCDCGSIGTAEAGTDADPQTGVRP